MCRQSSTQHTHRYIISYILFFLCLYCSFWLYFPPSFSPKINCSNLCRLFLSPSLKNFLGLPCLRHRSLISQGRIKFGMQFSPYKLHDQRIWVWQMYVIIETHLCSIIFYWGFWYNTKMAVVSPPHTNIYMYIYTCICWCLKI